MDLGTMTRVRAIEGGARVSRALDVIEPNVVSPTTRREPIKAENAKAEDSKRDGQSPGRDEQPSRDQFEAVTARAEKMKEETVEYLREVIKPEPIDGKWPDEAKLGQVEVSKVEPAKELDSPGKPGRQSLDLLA